METFQTVSVQNVLNGESGNYPYFPCCSGHGTPGVSGEDCGKCQNWTFAENYTPWDCSHTPKLFRFTMKMCHLNQVV